MVGWSVLGGDGGPQELVGVVFHGLKEDFVCSSLQEKGFLAVDPASDDAEGAAL